MELCFHDIDIYVEVGIIEIIFKICRSGLNTRLAS